MNKLAGHTFLARLGKKRLRPGGIKATSFLMKHASINQDTKILEVGCNMGTSAIELLKKYKNIHIVACDIDDEALKIAALNAKNAKVSHRITFIHADATSLPFENDSFDVIINEAMLTMLTEAKKRQAISEYYRVLKKGGRLLTHDVMLDTKDAPLQKEIIADLSRHIMVHVQPHTIDGWHQLFENNGFLRQIRLTGKMTLMNPLGMIRDEGLLGTLKIIKNALKKENRSRFKAMYSVFKKHRKSLAFIANVSFK